jgi:hypothetical protein
LSTLPASFFGSASRITTCSGILNFATPRFRAETPRRLAMSGCCARQPADDYRAGAFTGLRIGQADDGDLGDIRVADQQVLHFLGRNVLAIANDDVLECVR